MDLQARFTPKDSPFLRPDGTTDGKASIDTIEYILTNNELKEKAGIFEIVITIDTIGTNSPITDKDLARIDKFKAVNSIDYRTYALTGKQNCGELRLTPSTVSGCERTVKALNGSV